LVSLTVIWCAILTLRANRRDQEIRKYRDEGVSGAKIVCVRVILPFGQTVELWNLGILCNGKAGLFAGHPPSDRKRQEFRRSHQGPACKPKSRARSPQASPRKNS